MSKRRLWAAFAVAMICILTLTACKKNVGTPEDNAAAQGSSEEEQKKEQYIIGFSAIDMENPYFITLEHAAREVVEDEGYRMITRNPGADPSVQAVQIEEMIEEGIDAIILSPVNWEEITPSLQALVNAGVRIVNVDTQVKAMEYVDAYIGSDNYSAGFICGEDLIERCPEGGKIAILECPTQNSINERITGFEEALSLAERGFEVVAREDTGGEFEKGLRACEKIVKEHSDLAAIMCGNDQLAMGARSALKAVGMDEVLVYGVDGSPDIKKELIRSDSQVAGTAAQSPINMGKSAARTAIAVLTGTEYEKELYEEVFMIDKENVKMYGVDGWQ